MAIMIIVIIHVIIISYCFLKLFIGFCLVLGYGFELNNFGIHLRLVKLEKLEGLIFLMNPSNYLITLFLVIVNKLTFKFFDFIGRIFTIFKY